MKRSFWILRHPILVTLFIIGVGVFSPRAITQDSQSTSKDSIPMFQKDSDWPKPLPKSYYIGSVSGLSVDASQHVWVFQRPGGEKQRDPKKDADRAERAKNHPGVAAPPVMEFDNEGNLIQAWGGPDYVPPTAQGRKLPADYKWFNDEHGILADNKGHVWLTGHSFGDGGSNAPPGPELLDTHILEFTTDGKFLMMIGHPHSWGGSNDKQSLGNPTTMQLDPRANELFVADGEGNHRVIVFDANTGAYKRHWGAYGGVPDDELGEAKYDPSGPPSKQFGHRALHCLLLGNDGLLYVCDRANDRIQVFRKDGTFVKEVLIAPQTLGLGSIWSIGFSPDEKFLYVGDNGTHRVWILLRDQLKIVGSFGEKGSPSGEAGESHSMAVDSSGNIYVGTPLTKFAFKGFGPPKPMQSNQ